MIDEDRTKPDFYGRDTEEDRGADEILADPSHPIWKIMLALVGVLAAAWGVQSGHL